MKRGWASTHTERGRDSNSLLELSKCNGPWTEGHRQGARPEQCVCASLALSPAKQFCPSVPVSNFHAYFFNTIVLTALKCLGARIDALFITERVWRPLVAMPA